VELKPVEVTIHALDLQEVDLPWLRLRVRCSSGTYIRAVARDLGRILGVGGHLAALRRTSIGPLAVDSAAALEQLVSASDVHARLVSPAEALAHFPALEVTPQEAARLRQGQFLPVTGRDLPEEAMIRVLMDGELVAVAARSGNDLRPQKVLPHA
jgi:tRNA pseudouridine55 synthase